MMRKLLISEGLMTSGKKLVPWHHDPTKTEDTLLFYIYGHRWNRFFDSHKFPDRSFPQCRNFCFKLETYVLVYM